MKKLKYSLVWAEGVVKNLSQAHTRAFNFLMLNCGFTYGDAVILLATASKEFYVLREMIRYVDKTLYKPHSPEDFVPDDETTTRLIALFRARMAEIQPCLRKHPLTDPQMRLNLEEPSISGVGLGAAPPEPIPPMVCKPDEGLQGELSIDV